MVGSRFAGHPDMRQVAQFPVKATVAITSGIAPGLVLEGEVVLLHPYPRDAAARVLVVVDERSYEFTGGGAMTMEHHPGAWTRCVRHGRSSYLVLGHRSEPYADEGTVHPMTQGVVCATTSVAHGCHVARYPAKT